MRPALDAIYIVYWSLRDPLTRSQSLPALEALAREGWRVGLLTFEQRRWRLSAAEATAERERLAALGIVWRPLDYTKTPAVLSTAWDIARGALRVGAWARANGARLIHGRGSIPCAIAQGALPLCSAQFFADADGPLSQEYVDAGLWSAGSAPHRLAGWVEARALRTANRVAVLTEARRTEIDSLARHPVTVLPCGVDMRLFGRDPVARERRRSELEAAPQDRVLIYVGKSGGWYLTDAILDFAKRLAHVSTKRWRLLVLTPDPAEAFERGARNRGLSIDVRSAGREEVPEWLSAADAAISFRKPAPSQLASSPIKNGEYLACGLPIVSTPGAGDYSNLICRERVGVVVAGLDDSAYDSAVASLETLLEEPGLAERCRSVAKAHAALETVVVPRYLEIYRELLGEPGKASPRCAS